MQHDHVLKKLNFDPWNPSSRVAGKGGSVGKTFANHVAAFLILFNMMCNMTIF